jgi:hypothetical protein
VAITHAINPGTFILDALLRVIVGSSTMAESIENLTFVGAAISPVVTALSSDLIVFKFTFVSGAIGPLKGAFAIKKAMLKFTLVLVTVFEDTSALAVIHFANLKDITIGELPVRFSSSL